MSDTNVTNKLSEKTTAYKVIVYSVAMVISTLFICSISVFAVTTWAVLIRGCSVGLN